MILSALAGLIGSYGPLRLPMNATIKGRSGGKGNGKRDAEPATPRRSETAGAVNAPQPRQK